MKKHAIYFAIVFLSISLFSCGRFLKKNETSSWQVGKGNPPNCVKVDEHFFMDKTEVCNLDWKEFLYWTKQTLSDSKHDAMLPDTAVWVWPNDSVTTHCPLIYSYFTHPSFDTYPVVGISYEQAQAYSNWRSDRVYETILIRLGKIAANPNQDSASYFTIEKYLKGQYMGIQPDFSIPVPRFRLPTEKEWTLATDAKHDLTNFPFGYDLGEKQNANFLKKYGPKAFFKTKDWMSISKSDYFHACEMMSANGRAGVPNDFGIFNMIGNVAEMVEERGIAKGGSFMQPLEKCKISERQSYDIPSKWIGFRCVSFWEMPKNQLFQNSK